MPTITYNIPADKQADVLDALRAHYQTPAATPTQLNDLVAADLKKTIRDIYTAYMRRKVFDVVLD